MTLIQIPDDQAAALQAKAAAQGLTLEAWLRNLAGLEEPRVRKGRYSLADLVAQCDPTAPLSEEDKAWLDELGMGREAV
jgi:antitoxin component of MazEF toxin-antitoxin module